MDTKELRDILAQLATRWGEYHDHKETMAWNATALQLTLCVAVILYIISASKGLEFIVCIILTVVIFWTHRISLLFVRNQLKAKDAGADFTAACTKLIFYETNKLEEIITTKKELDPLLTLENKDEPYPSSKKPSPFVPKFIFDESEKQRELDTSKNAINSDISRFNFGLIWPSESQDITIREKTANYYYSLLNVITFFCVLSIWLLYFLQPATPLLVSYILRVLHYLGL